MVLTEKKRVPAVCGQGLSKGSEKRESSAERHPQPTTKRSVTHLPGQDPEVTEVVQIASQEHFQRNKVGQVLSLCFPDH